MKQSVPIDADEGSERKPLLRRAKKAVPIPPDEEDTEESEEEEAVPIRADEEDTKKA